MTLQEIGQTGLQGSRLALGCMRMGALELSEAVKVLDRSLELGINFFDHADIYAGGRSEEIFGQAVKELGLGREQLLIQSKCGIRKGFFDFSKEHIISSVEQSLQRLQTDYLDFLVLHRPDTLLEPEEVAEAFDHLQSSGKVRHFGVSNQNPMQIELLQSALSQKLEVNQLQLSPVHTPMIDAGLNVNMTNGAAINRDGSILDYSRLKEMTIQAWSPFQIDLNQGLFVGHEDFKELNQTLTELAENYGVSYEAMVVAWILRHPAKMQVLLGSMNPERLSLMAEANKVDLSREDWYAIYRSSGKLLP